MVNTFPPDVLKGLACMAEGRYFEAHEHLEEAWRAESGPIRDLYQGLLQAAVVAYHVQRGNWQGALKVYRRALRHLEPWPEVVYGLDVEALRRSLHTLAEQVRAAQAGSPPEAWSWPKPVWRDISKPTQE